MNVRDNRPAISGAPLGSAGDNKPAEWHGLLSASGGYTVARSRWTINQARVQGVDHWSEQMTGAFGRAIVEYENLMNLLFPACGGI